MILSIGEVGKGLRLVGDDVLLFGPGILDLGALVENLLGLIVDDDSETHILSQFDDMVEDLRACKQTTLVFSFGLALK